ncbi:MGMT family protein [Rothia sp. AR01]|uniref:MGMT family protein n=1 Tax=Rothia santali TaxID=2949643 RepID=A0A9X2HHQ4_9MICC|nr:MGMT family protein [Rothia santali]MCP3425088.1 MGMT family protein [Rothia santali]
MRIERVLRAVECIPEGRAATYGTLGRICGESPRTVGRVLSLWGSNVAWWRVVNAGGAIPGHAAEAEPHWRREGLLAAGPDAAGPSGVAGPGGASGSGRASGSARTGRAGTGPVVELRRVAADEAELRRRWEAAVADLAD